MRFAPLACIAFAALGTASIGCTVETTTGGGGTPSTPPATITVDETCRRLLAAQCQRKADLSCFPASEVAKCETNSFDPCKQNSAQSIKDNGADPAKVDACVTAVKAAADCAGVDAAGKCG
ncbi:MAG: hypothetical protein IPF92_13720 [Myxococcales bacterium]|nr:hypothetical protein [Myxococcales bacterium]HQY60517.1 hypothetical protein [Polyangiaceae bacterium]